MKGAKEGFEARATPREEEESKVRSREVGRFAATLGLFGHHVARHPVFVICLMLLLTCLASVGFVRIKIISDGVKLWVPQESKAMFDRKAVTKMFVTNNNFMMYL